MIANLKAMAAHVAAGAGEASDHAEEAAGLPQLDVSTYTSQLFWLAITFGLLYLLLAKVFLPRLSALLEERRDRVADDLDAAAGLRSEAEDAEHALTAAMADARARAHAIVAKQREKLTAEIDAETAEAEAALDARMAEADEKIEQRKSEALARVREAASDTAGAVVQKLIGVSPSEADVARAIDSASGKA